MLKKVHQKNPHTQKHTQKNNNNKKTTTIKTHQLKYEITKLLIEQFDILTNVFPSGFGLSVTEVIHHK